MPPVTAKLLTNALFWNGDTIELLPGRCVIVLIFDVDLDGWKTIAQKKCRIRYSYAIWSRLYYRLVGYVTLLEELHRRWNEAWFGRSIYLIGCVIKVYLGREAHSECTVLKWGRDCVDAAADRDLWEYWKIWRQKLRDSLEGWCQGACVLLKIRVFKFYHIFEQGKQYHTICNIACGRTCFTADEMDVLPLSR